MMMDAYGIFNQVTIQKYTQMEWPLCGALQIMPTQSLRQLQMEQRRGYVSHTTHASYILHL
eukprot:14741417-Ditylum_brightwellii.AAC.1